MKELKKNELREGNYVRDARSRNIGMVIKVKNLVTAQMQTVKLKQPVQEFQPVKLKESMLTGFGMNENILTSNYWIVPSFILEVKRKFLTTEFYHFDKKIEYVHELQNVYFEYSRGRELYSTQFEEVINNLKKTSWNIE